MPLMFSFSFEVFELILTDTFVISGAVSWSCSCFFRLITVKHDFIYSANLTSLSLEENTGHLLATYRPTNKHPHIRHQAWNNIYIERFDVKYRA